MKLNRILLIDDDSITNFLHQSLLETAEIADDILVAETVPEAVKALMEIENDSAFPQLIFVDLNMPGLSGWDFIREYGQLKLNRNLKTIVVVLTTSLNPDDKKRAETISAVTEFRHKPLTLGMVDEIKHQYFG